MTTRIIKVLLLILIVLLHIRVYQLEHRVSWLTDELIKSKQSEAEVDTSIASFMKSTNETFMYTRQALDGHSRAILNLAGAR